MIDILWIESSQVLLISILAVYGMVAMNDIYWAAFVGNVGRMMELIELECVDPKCSLGDPWGVTIDIVRKYL